MKKVLILIFYSLTFLITAAVHAQNTYTYLLEWGTENNKQPYGVATDDSGNVFVTTQFDYTVQNIPIPECSAPSGRREVQ